MESNADVLPAENSDDGVEANPSAGVVPYAHHRDAAPRGDVDDLMRLPTEALGELLNELVGVEGPIHEEEAARAIAEMYQARVSPRMREGFDLALEHAVDYGLVRKRDEFLWPADEREPSVRLRAEGCPVTKPELIAPEELEAAVVMALRQQYGLKSDAAVEATARLMGFARTGGKLKVALEEAIRRLDERGEIRLDSSDYVTLK